MASEENKDEKFGWENAVVLAATVKIDRAAADAWLPKPVLNISDVDEAILFVAWYPDSFCCGAYHEAALLLKVAVTAASAALPVDARGQRRRADRRSRDPRVPEEDGRV